MKRLHHLRRARRGVSLVLVLGLVAIALALSFALLRAQATAVQVQRNSGRQVEARQAALAGLSEALRRMHEPNWSGVDTQISGKVGEHAWYEATYETGDAGLRPSDAEYAEYAFRVTVTATGQAAHPERPEALATHRARAVVQLVRRALTEQPANWQNLQEHTVYQWGNVNAFVQVPVQVAGRALLQGPLQLCVEYPSYEPARKRYLEDLERMRAAGLGDFRPLTGTVSLPFIRNLWSTLIRLANELGIPLRDIFPSDSAPLSPPIAARTYRLYPGGKLYEPPSIQSQFGGRLSGVSLRPDPQTNPLGIFPSAGPLALDNNVSIEGTVVTSGIQPDIQIYGQNVAILGRDLPPLDGSAQRLQLPAALVLDDFRVRDQAIGSLKGLVVVWDEFEFRHGSAQLAFDVEGRVLTRALRLMGRDSWVLDSSSWRGLLESFQAEEAQLKLLGQAAYFPLWLEQNAQLKAKPLLTIRPDSSGVAYHWQDFTQPIYVPHPNDGGLRWNVVRWQDSF